MPDAAPAAGTLERLRQLLQVDAVAVSRRQGETVEIVDYSGDTAHLACIATHPIEACPFGAPLVIADTARVRGLAPGRTRFYAAIPMPDGTDNPALTLHLCDARPRGPAMAHRLEAMAIEVTSRATIGRMLRQRAHERGRHEAELRAQNERFERASETASIGIWECDLSDESLTWTSGVYDIFEIPRGAPIDRESTLQRYTAESRAAMAAARARAIAQCGDFSVEVEIVTLQGRQRWMRITGTVEARDGKAVRIFGMKQDITEQRLLADRTRYLAETDVMTGLANRSRFQARLDLADAGHNRQPLSAMLLVDLDGFKQINDNHGHVQGDRCLIEAAQRLSSCCQGAELVARIGGDEFAVLLGPDTAPDAAQALAAQIVETIGRPFVSDGQLLALSASVGLAHDDGLGPDDLLRRADMALYAAKAAGRNTSRVHGPRVRSA